MDIETLNPNIADLTAMVEESKKIISINFENKEEVEMVKGHRIKLRDARIVIQKKGKEMREDAIAFQKTVIAKEKELIAIVEPEEDRLAALEDEAKKQAEIQSRVPKLPERKNLLKEKDLLTDDITDEYLLSLDDGQFNFEYNRRLQAKNEAKEREIADRERKVREAEEKAAEEARIKEREENARVQERERIEREQRQRDLEAAEKKRQAEAAEKQRIEDEKKRLAADKIYQDFLAENGYNEGTKSQFYITKTGDEVKLYKLAGVLKLKE